MAAGKSGRFPRHFKANDIIKRAVALAGFPAKLEPSGLSKDGSKKRPDGYTSGAPVGMWTWGRVHTKFCQPP